MASCASRSRLFQRPFPREAIALAESHRELVAPWLVQLVEKVGRDPAVAAHEDYRLHIFAMVLLGHWRDTRAYRPLLAWARLPEGVLDELLGDAVQETYGRAVASVCDGDMEALAQIARDEDIDVWVRLALLTAWKVRVTEGDAPLAPFAASEAAGARRGAD